MSSIFASLTSVTVTVPHDAPQTVTIRKLTGRELETAQADHLRGLIAGRTARGWADVFQRSVREGTATESDAMRMLRDPLNGFDRTSIVRAGLTGWTYAATVTEAQIDDLDDETLEFLALSILKLTKPQRFATPEEVEAETKKG